MSTDKSFTGVLFVKVHIGNHVRRPSLTQVLRIKAERSHLWCLEPRVALQRQVSQLSTLAKHPKDTFWWNFG